MTTPGRICCSSGKPTSSWRRWRTSFREARLAQFTLEYRQLIVVMATMMYRYHEACSVEPFDIAACRNSMQSFLEALAGFRLLCRRGLPAQQHAVQPFHLRPKSHMLAHLVNENKMLSGVHQDLVGVLRRRCCRTGETNSCAHKASKVDGEVSACQEQIVRRPSCLCTCQCLNC